MGQSKKSPFRFRVPRDPRNSGPLLRLQAATPVVATAVVKGGHPARGVALCQTHSTVLGSFAKVAIVKAGTMLEICEVLNLRCADLH